MRVAVTRGTGFVGSHGVAELLRAGHEVTLLVRSPDRVAPALRPFGYRLADVGIVEGDVTDPLVAARAVDGCEAVLHAAAVFSNAPGAADAIRETNVRATEVVLSAAVRRGVGRIIHVSSIAALMGEPGATLGPDSHPAHPRGVYAASKADSERVARRYQEAGAPVVISYPAFVMGPRDPHFGEAAQFLRDILRRRHVVLVGGTCPISDVRDVARMHARLVEAPLRHTRYVTPTTVPTVNEFVRLLRERTGRALPMLILPAGLVRAGLLGVDRAVDALGLPSRWRSGGASFFSLGHRFDDSATRSEFGIEPMRLAQTIDDVIQWMAQSGHIAPKLAGRLAA